MAQYQQVYDPTFGRVNSVVYPSLGDGDYGDTGTPDNSGFLSYFTNTGVFSRIAQAGTNTANLTSNVYYSYNLGSWHIIALNSQCAAIHASNAGGGGCGIGSNEERWLRADLAANPGMCTLAYWHVPRWNSGSLGNRADSSAFWTDLYKAHADLVLNAHGNNHYERFVPQDPLGQPDPGGIREFIVSNVGFSDGQPPSTAGDRVPAPLPTTRHLGFCSWFCTPAPIHGSSCRPVVAPSRTRLGDMPLRQDAAATTATAGVPEHNRDRQLRSTNRRAQSQLAVAGPQASGEVSVSASGITAGGSDTSSATWVHEQFAANQESYLTVPKLPPLGGFVQVGGRVSSLTGSVSLFCASPVKNLWDIRKKLNGAGSTSIGTFAAPFAAGDSLGLKLIGSTLTAYHQHGSGAWASVASVTDTSITNGGYLTFTLGDTAARGGAFGGGNSS